MPVPKLPLHLTGTLRAYHLWWWRRQALREPILGDWNYANRAIFIHIPKTAGTSVFRLIGARPPNDTHAPAAAYQNTDPSFFRDAYKFTFVRNPWDRFASSFAFLQSGTEWPMQQAWARRHLAGLDFASFTRRLRHRRFRAIVASERFFWPQSFWLEGTGAAAPVDEIFRFETVEAAGRSLCDRLGREVPATLPHERRSDRPPYRTLYDAEMIDIVGDFYLKDVRRFGYEF